jgi:hypothetical protein
VLGGSVFEFNTGRVEIGSADVLEHVCVSEKRLFINWNLLARENLPKSSSSYLSTGWVHLRLVVKCDNTRFESP